MTKSHRISHLLADSESRDAVLDSPRIPQNVEDGVVTATLEV